MKKIICILSIMCSIAFSSCNKYECERKPKMAKPDIQSVKNQPSYIVASDVVTACVTQTGGHIGPIKFRVGNKEISPLSVSPWWNEKLPDDMPNVVRVLRGDLFCLPFGINAEPYNGERHPVHGETANNIWKFEEFHRNDKEIQLHLSMQTTIRKGRVDKYVRLIPGQNIVYQRDIISNMSGPMPLGHHVMVKIPDYPNSAFYSCSPFSYAQVAVREVELPENKGYSRLKTAEIVNDLKRVPNIFGGYDNMTVYPSAKGYEDVISVASTPENKIAWNVMVFPKEKYLFFTLRDPNILRSTMLWISNGGRYYAPWNGRHTNVLGIEDYTGFYHYGLADAVGENVHNQKGIRTVVELSETSPLAVNYIFGIAEIPENFGRVVNINFDADKMAFYDEASNSVSIDIDLGFLSLK